MKVGFNGSRGAANMRPIESMEKMLMMIIKEIEKLNVSTRRATPDQGSCAETFNPWY